MQTAYQPRGEFKLSVCICTRNRPDELAKALISVQNSSYPIHETIVSDDSTDLRTMEMVKVHFPEVIVMEGPKKGLCANRNHALSRVSGTHVLFIDDDVLLGESFVESIYAHLLEHDLLDGEHIVTGLEYRNQHLIHPHDQSFLGFQTKIYGSGEPIKTVVINSTVFPRRLFDTFRFDEQLRYGYDEVDLTTRASGARYTIHICERAVNQHYPAEANRDYYKPYIDASRLYVTYKRYRYSEQSLWKSNCFLGTAALHVVLHGLIKNGWSGIKQAGFTLKTTVSYIRTYEKNVHMEQVPLNAS